MKTKICLVVLLIVFFYIILPIKTTHASTISDIITSADDNFLQAGSIDGTIDDSQLESTSNFLYKVLLAIGIVVMFIVGTIIGIKFMVASVEEKAKVKEALIPYIVGCIVILGAFTIWRMVVDAGQSIFPTPKGKKVVTSSPQKSGGTGSTVDEDGFAGHSGKF